MSFAILIETIDPLVLSAHIATEAQHETLKFIPGGALLGIAAALLYGRQDRVRNDLVFHSGVVRFGDALPVDALGRVGWPMPLSLHVEKRHAPTFGQDGNVRNGVHADLRAEDKQYEQIRGGFLGLQGQAVQVRTRTVTKTAIDETTGRARDGQLFAYEAIESGQRFLSWIDTPAGFDDADLRTALEGERLLGRSRSAEFGRVRIRVVDAPFMAQRSVVHPGGPLVLWCLSPLVLLDASGQPTLCVEGRHIGIDAARFDASRSFLRTARVSRFNRHRHAYDPEQALIARGSVLVFNAVPAGTEIPCWLGGDSSLGYGRVWVNPPCLGAAGFQTDPGSATLVVSASEGVSNAPDSELVRWLRAAAHTGGDRSADVKEWAEQLGECYTRARRESPTLPKVGPSKTQWHGFGEIARKATHVGQVLDDVTKGSGPCKANGRGWKDPWFEPGLGMLTFHEWLKQEIDGVEKSQKGLTMLREFAREAARVAEQKQGGAR